jgi:glycosyltransferase involved in cell wall biosynthesis
MVVGLPVVITRGIQISPEIEAAQAGTIIDDTQTSLTAALLDLLRSPEKRRAMGERGQHFARTTYSWSAIAHQLIDEYTKIQQQNPQHLGS